jgi:hypothetical protein
MNLSSADSESCFLSLVAFSGSAGNDKINAAFTKRRRDSFPMFWHRTSSFIERTTKQTPKRSSWPSSMKVQSLRWMATMRMMMRMAMIIRLYVYVEGSRYLLVAESLRSFDRL